jgi:O-antigen/teichoic acid export membrane protein
MSTVIVNAYNLFLIGRIITRFFSQKGMGGGYGFDRALAGKIMSYSLPVFLSGLCNVPILWIANTLLASRWGFGEVGVFNAAYNLAIQVAFITTAINYPLVPLYSKLLAEGDHSGLEKLFLKNIKMTCLITLAMALVMGLNARWIIWTLYGPAYGASEMILVWMVVSVVLSSINSVIGMLILASGKVWIALMVNAIWTMVVSVFLFLLIPRMGAISIAISFVMAYLIHTLVLNLVTSKVFTIRIRDWKILVSSLSLLLVPFLNRFHNPFISNVSLGIILVILWVLNVNAFEKKVMLSFLKKQIYVL